MNAHSGGGVFVSDSWPDASTMSVTDSPNLENSKMQKFRSKQLDRAALLLRWMITDEGMSLITPGAVWLYPVEKGGFLLIAVVAQELLNGCIKWVFQTPRPFWRHRGIENIGGKWEQDYSFPSSHAQISATFATSFALFDSEASIWLTFAILSLVTGWARVYLGVHTTTCVAVGWLCGIFITFALWWLDPIAWYTELESRSSQLFVWVSIVIVPYVALELIRRVSAPPPDSVMEKWTENARFNSGSTAKDRILKIRRLSKYHFQIFSLLGGAIGTTFSTDAFQAQTLSFVEENCPQSGSILPPLLRCAWCYSILVAFIMPAAFVLPTVLKRKNVPASVVFAVQFPALTLVGFWGLYGCPASANKLFGINCPILSSCKGVEVLPQTTAISCPKTYQFEGCLHGAPNIWVPSSEDELQAMILNAKTQNVLVRVRAACHSTPGASHQTSYYYQDFNNETNQVRDRDVQFISLTHRNFAKYQVVEEDDGQQFVVAGAGIMMGQSPTFNRTWEESITAQMWNDGFAVDHLGGTTQLSLGGFLSVGANGPGSRYSLESNVVGLRFINGLGEKVEVWRNLTKNDSSLPFDAFLVNLGLMGVLYEVVLKPSPAYCVTNELSFFEDVEYFQVEDLLMRRDYSRLFIDFFRGGVSAFAFSSERSYNVTNCSNTKQFQASSHGQLAALDVLYGLKSDTSCFVEQLRVASNSFTTPEDRDICAVHVYNKMLKTYRSIDNEEAMHLESCLKRVQEEWRAHGFHRQHLEVANKKLTKACALPALIHFKQHGRENNLFRYYLGVAVDDWTMTYRDFGYDMTEMWFSLERYTLAQVLGTVKDLARTLAGRFAPVFPGPEIYMAPGSSSWLSPCYGAKHCVRVSIVHQARQYDEMKSYFDTFHRAFSRRGLYPTFHWGKYVSRDVASLEKMRAQLPMLGKFLELRKLQDPDNLFLTEDWKLFLGL